MRYICREDKEQTKILVVYFGSVASHMEQRLGASKSCNVKVKWLWMRQGMDKIELWVDTDEPDGNEFGCWCGVSCAAAKRENHGNVDS